MNAMLSDPVCARFTEAQRRNAISLLKRVPIKGEEAKALVEIMDILLKAAPDPNPQLSISR
jgi:hypothetical protein